MRNTTIAHKKLTDRQRLLERKSGLEHGIRIALKTAREIGGAADVTSMSATLRTLTCGPKLRRRVRWHRHYTLQGC